jgi:UDP-N-acetylmuramoyl-L-alanyl-D-glutamate--2,6-diaminopimelate ligase
VAAPHPPAPLRTLGGVPETLAWLRQQVRGRLCSDSRQVQPGDAFIAWPGYAHDARQFVPAALAAGAAACLVERQGAEPFAFADPRVAALPGLKAATGWLADAWYEQPSHRLDVVAATGTNGKSSTAWWTAQALTLLGRRCGLVGTLGVGMPPVPGLDEAGNGIESTGLTTPDPLRLQAALRGFVDAGCYACALEASSIGLAEHRLAGTRVAVAQFTNFTRDHLDYHGSMQAYWDAKRELFAWPGLKAAVVNVDDEQGARLASELAAAHVDLWTTSVQGPARLGALDLHYADGGLAFTLVEGDTRLPVRSALIGDYNAANLLAVLGALRALGLPLADAAATVARLTPVPGRMQRVGHSAGQPEVVVDYAHTPDALDKALGALRPLAQARGGRLWCVFGCGGNRDASKRPLMGAMAEQGADAVVVTSDNPRLENPALIIEQVVAGASDPRRLQPIEDRRAAIQYAVATADPADVLLLAGKGHEDYQDLGGEKRPFSDVAEARAALALRRPA